MQKFHKFIVASVFSLALSACVTEGDGENTMQENQLGKDAPLGAGGEVAKGFNLFGLKMNGAAVQSMQLSFVAELLNHDEEMQTIELQYPFGDCKWEEGEDENGEYFDKRVWIENPLDTMGYLFEGEVLIFDDLYEVTEYPEEAKRYTGGKSLFDTWYMNHSEVEVTVQETMVVDQKSVSVSIDYKFNCSSDRHASSPGITKVDCSTVSLSLENGSTVLYTEMFDKDLNFVRRYEVEGKTCEHKRPILPSESACIKKIESICDPEIEELLGNKEVCDQYDIEDMLESDGYCDDYCLNFKDPDCE